MNDAGKVTDIYFLTQLTPDEKVSMVGPLRLVDLIVLRDTYRLGITVHNM